MAADFDLIFIMLFYKKLDISGLHKAEGMFKQFIYLIDN